MRNVNFVTLKFCSLGDFVTLKLLAMLGDLAMSRNFSTLRTHVPPKKYNFGLLLQCAFVEYERQNINIIVSKESMFTKVCLLFRQLCLLMFTSALQKSVPLISTQVCFDILPFVVVHDLFCLGFLPIDFISGMQ